MKLYHTFTACEKTAAGRVVTIGNFDGCHLGHQRLIARTLRLAAATGRRSLAVSFEPHPKAFFSPTPESERLYSPEQKVRMLAELGLDEVLIQGFDGAFSQITHDDYYERILKTGLETRELVIGDDFRFGFKRLGNNIYLQDKSDHDGIKVHIESPESYRQEPISSSRIRRVIRAGHVEAACDMLGRPYALESIVATGAKLGRTIGIPTANLGKLEQLVPAVGVYAGYAWIDSNGSGVPPLASLPTERYRAVFNVGVRPTVRDQETKEIKVEAHLIGEQFGPDALYGKRIAIFFAHRLRDEVKFPSLEALKAQIQADIATATGLLK